MKPLLSVSVALMAVLTVQGCAKRTVPVYMPGYYQEGRYHDPGYTPAHYNAYGQFYPAQMYARYYEPGRWHRGYYNYHFESQLPTPMMSSAVVGVIKTGTLSSVAGDAGMPNTTEKAGQGMDVP